jgi:hypothetical protein
MKVAAYQKEYKRIFKILVGNEDTAQERDSVYLPENNKGP